MSLRVKLTKQLPGFRLDVSFSCRAGQLLVIVGPSGSGKTTVLRMIAGLEQPDAGCVAHDDTVLYESTKGHSLAPQRRRIGYVSQGYHLFPHLTVAKNVAFAAKNSKKVEKLLSLFGIAHLAGVYPAKISGGERQRAALAQALATEPRMLLLDEPFSALDYKNKNRLRQEIVTMKTTLNLPMVLVTHDIEDALRMADTILPMADGCFSPLWLPEELKYVPAAPFSEGINLSCKPLSIQTSYPVGCAL